MIATWSRLPRDADLSREWDDVLLRSEDGNAFQSSGWGEYKRESGWVPERWLARDRGGAIVMAAQVLVRAVDGVRVGWAPGGPVFLFPASAWRHLDELLDLLLRNLAARARFSYVRFDSYVPRAPDLAYAFGASCARPARRLNTGYSSRLDLSQPLERILSGMTHKHRYNLKKALAHDVVWRLGTDSEAVRALAGIRAEMLRLKHLTDVPTFDVAELATLCRAMQESALIFTGHAAGEPIASCLVLTFGRRAFLYAPATGERGRELGIAYAMAFRLLEHLKARGFAELDLAGLDPRSPSAGVDRFKLGFGGDIVEYLGEWEWSSHAWLRWAVNFAVGRRYPRAGRHEPGSPTNDAEA